MGTPGAGLNNFVLRTRESVRLFQTLHDQQFIRAARCKPCRASGVPKIYLSFPPLTYPVTLRATGAPVTRWAIPLRLLCRLKAYGLRASKLRDVKVKIS